MEQHWSQEAIFYHIYPLGLCGAPRRNDFGQPPQPRLNSLYSWLDHIQSLGVNALYLGPVFESTAHGYDAADYYHVDRRLGDRQTLQYFSQEVHRRGMRLVLDGVFNHVGRDFWAFRDIQANGEHSAYTGWFQNLKFGQRSRLGDWFNYEGWAGNYDLVKLNLSNPNVCNHLLEAVRLWVDLFQIDGLRLDAADVVAPDFLAELSSFSRSLRSDFWLMGEMVHGDYRRLANPGMLDSTTNYEVYKSLYSSFTDRNFFEVAYAFNRQSGPTGIYRELALYTFADNHDVNRVASNLKNLAHLYPLYCLLFSAPGIPSIYYGSEWGMKGERTNTSDIALRPALTIEQQSNMPQPDLAKTITRLANLRSRCPALCRGDYRQLHVNHEQMAFLRTSQDQKILVAINAADQPAAVTLQPGATFGKWVDWLNPGESFETINHQVKITIPATWARIMVLEG